MSSINLLTVLVWGILAIALAYVAYAQLQLRQRRALYQRFYTQPLAIENGLRISLFHLVKGGRIVVPATPLFQLFGISSVEHLNLLPLLLYFEACVYAGDEATEAYYRGDTAAVDSSWARSITAAATQLGIQDAALAEELTRLSDYYAAESALMRRATPLTDSALYEINLARSHDVQLILRAALRLLHRPMPEALLSAIQPWLTIGEILDDLGSYEKDLRSGSFNTLGLLVQLHSSAHAISALRQLCHELAQQLYLRLQQVEGRYVGRFLGFFLFRKYGVSAQLIGCLAYVVPKQTLLNWAMHEVRALVALQISKLPPILPPAAV